MTPHSTDFVQPSGNAGFTDPRRGAGRHRRTRTPGMRRATATAATVGATLVPAALTPVASAQELTAEGIMAELEELSRKAEANSEAVTVLDGQVADQERIIATLHSDVARARGHAEQIRVAADATRDRVGRLARGRLRGAPTDPITAVLGADDTQAAIDRTSYVRGAQRSADELLEQARIEQRAAADAHARAASAEAAARFQLGQLEHRRGELARESEQLERTTEEVRARVDSLSPEQQRLWRLKNNPVSEGLAALAGTAGVVDAALSKIGAPYTWGAAGPDAFDCSGLMYWAYQQMGKTIPRTSQAQLAGGTPVSRDQLQPGDLIGFYPGVTHVGMYVGDGKIIHASDYGIPVQVVPIDQGGPYQGAVRY